MAIRDELFLDNRHQMLEKIRFIWIKGLLERSLYQLARIELELEPRPDAVQRHSEQAPQPLQTGTSIGQIFDEAGNALLILGTPGTGKTTLLLELTRDLLDRAVQNERHLIPVVFNLSSWAEQRLALADWLMDELHKRYDVPRQLAKTWVDLEIILPLLDGLDEVAIDHREACAEAINTFLREHSRLPMVVCSRVADYEALTVRLRLPSAVIIQLLSREQVQRYFDHTGIALIGLRTALQDDDTFWDLLNTPLMLDIATHAYKGRSADEIASVGTVEEYRRHVFAAYTDAMFHRGPPTTLYTRGQTEHWLIWLAKAMKDHSETIFYLEWMQPDWLPVQRQQRLVAFVTSVLSVLLFGLIIGLSGLSDGLSDGLGFGLIGGLIVGIRSPFSTGLLFGVGGVLFGGLDYGLGWGWVSWVGGLLGAVDILLFMGLSFGLIGGLLSGLVGYSTEIQPVEKLRWSWSAARYQWRSKLGTRLRVGLVCGLGVGLGYGMIYAGGELPAEWDIRWDGGLVYGLVRGLVWGLFNRLVFGLGYGLVFGLDYVLHLRLLGGLVRYSRTRYQWIPKLQTRLLGGLGVGLLGGLGIGLGVELGARFLHGLFWGLFWGLFLGLVGILLGGLGGLSFGLLFGVLDGVRVGEIGTQSFPNEGIRRSVRTASISGLGLGLIFGLFCGLGLELFVRLGSGLAEWRGVELPDGLNLGLRDLLDFGLPMGLLFGLGFGLRFGGRACLQHFALRLVLWHKNFAPLHYIRFLDYATARIFLRKVGGGYIFVHRMLLEYFAAMHQTSTEQQHCNKNG